MKTLSYKVFYVMFLAVTAFSFCADQVDIKKLSVDFSVNQNLLDDEKSAENQILEVESLDEPVDSYLNNFAVVELRFNYKLHAYIESSLLLISGSKDIRIPPPKNI